MSNFYDGELSRITNMNYIYELELRLQDFPPKYIIKEYIGVELKAWFFLHQLIF